jgi:hypothetical protein
MTAFFGNTIPASITENGVKVAANEVEVLAWIVSRRCGNHNNGSNMDAHLLVAGERLRKVGDKLMALHKAHDVTP